MSAGQMTAAFWLVGQRHLLALGCSPPEGGLGKTPSVVLANSRVTAGRQRVEDSDGECFVCGSGDRAVGRVPLSGDGWRVGAPALSGVQFRVAGMPKPRPDFKDKALSAQSVANYIAKYAIKTLDARGLPSRPLRHRAQIDSLHCPAHYRRMMHAAWALASPKAANDPRLRRSAHQLGWGGHFLTKSRRYSVTFRALRQARLEHRKRQRHPLGEHDSRGRPLDDTVVLVLQSWGYDGTRPNHVAGPDMALASAGRAREHDQDLDT